MELCDRASFTRLQVLQVEAAYQIVITPDVFAYKMYLDKETFLPMCGLKFSYSVFSCKK